MAAVMTLAIAVAFAIAAAFAVAVHAAGASAGVTVAAALVLFGAALVPPVLVYAAGRRRAAVTTRRVRELADAAADNASDLPYAPRDVEDVELARALEHVRAALMRHRGTAEQHRAAMTEIVASLREGLIGVGSDGRVVVANRRITEMFGGGDDLVGRSILEVVRKRSVAAAFDDALRGHASTHRVAIGSGARERNIEIRAFPVETSSELAAVALFIDVTEIERLQRIRKDFLDDFSHEVRTPLAGLKSAAETLLSDGLSDESEQQLHYVMQRQIARIERLVADVSELNQIEAGEIVLERSPLDLRQLVEELCDDFRRRKPDFRFRLSGEQTIAAVDPARAQQIFTNLFDNAWRHGGGAGEIEVEVASDASDAVVRVSDRGPGIPPAELERIFNRFYRVDRSRSTPGTGLGLAIAKHLVVRHGGSIRASNRPGGGAIFEVRLPREIVRER